MMTIPKYGTVIYAIPKDKGFVSDKYEVLIDVIPGFEIIRPSYPRLRDEDVIYPAMITGRTKSVRKRGKKITILRFTGKFLAPPVQDLIKPGMVIADARFKGEGKVIGSHVKYEFYSDNFKTQLHVYENQINPHYFIDSLYAFLVTEYVYIQEERAIRGKIISDIEAKVQNENRILLTELKKPNFDLEGLDSILWWNCREYY